MQQMLASLIVSMGVQDTAFKSGMAAARADAKRTGQNVERSADGMAASLERMAHRANAAAIHMADGIVEAGNKVRNVGLGLTAGLTLGLGGLAVVAKNTASDFQSAMNAVRAAMITASSVQLDKLRDAALRLGPAMGRSAIEAAGAIEMLAKNGMSAAEILNGGLDSALKLAVVGQTDLSGAADATTDIVTQFGMTASQLPGVVNKVTGALDASKLSFDGYKDAIGQAGGIAGGLGYTFDDLNTALAATVPLMTGGSDAGTAFKTFLLSLVPQSKDAAGVMKDLGLSFFDAQGSVKSLAEIAETLNTQLSGLNQRSRQQALTKIFGTDGMRVAVALMQAGAKGIEDMQRQIDAVTADQKLEVLLDGEAAATQRLASAWEQLKIAIGEAGILQFFTLVKDTAAGMIGAIASAPPWFMKLVVVAGLAAASIGPLILAGLSLAKVVLPLLLLRLGPVALAFAAIINPMGVILRLLGQLALQAGAATVIGRLGLALAGMAGPIGLAVTALSLLIPLYMRLGQVSQDVQRQTAALAGDQDRGRSIMLQLATATGKAKDEALKHAKALRAQRIEALGAARAQVALARAEYVKERAKERTPAPGIISAVMPLVTGRNRVGAARDLVESDRIYRERLAGLKELDAAIADAGKPAAGPGRNIDFDAEEEKKKRKKKGRDAARDEAAYEDELGRMRIERLQADADLTGSIRSRYEAEMAAIAEDRASFVRQNTVDKGLSDAQRATLLAEKDRGLEVRRAAAEQARFNALAEQDFEIARARGEAEQDLLRAQMDLADSATARRVIALRLLDLQRRQEEAEIEYVLATEKSTSFRYQQALDRKKGLNADYAGQRATAMQSTETPAQTFLRDINRSGDAMRESIQLGAINAMQGLNSELANAGFNVRKLGDAFANMGRRIIGSLMEIVLQQRLIKPLASRLLGEGGGGGWLGKLAGSIGGLSGSTTGTGTLDMASLGQVGWGGSRAVGGSIKAGKWYDVGERGPERFYPGVSGTIVPNGGRGAGPAQARVTIMPSPYFDGVVDGRAARVASPIAASSTAQGMGSASRRQARASRQTLG